MSHEVVLRTSSSLQDAHFMHSLMGAYRPTIFGKVVAAHVEREMLSMEAWICHGWGALDMQGEIRGGYHWTKVCKDGTPDMIIVRDHAHDPLRRELCLAWCCAVSC